MGVHGPDSFDKRSLSSRHSQQSLQNIRSHVLKKSTSQDHSAPSASAVTVATTGTAGSVGRPGSSGGGVSSPETADTRV